ncbi:hypothetical protein CKM354_000791600 [Cercospora kikuchii]|uniref:Heterokaryon incompatibility domain-containing protein n=1 Tax=Cercospora kikuchii TaxID=84275 RepID=A0A9P3CS22_9PEZI|nr:uncharacterized protein CKM354_000791600 [Cercospora kikuchii]GIZ44725.1 hypothetical protein CKM354_000791600 [Cercospora kikuchii]
MRPPYKYRPLEPDTIRLLRILPDSQPDDIRCELVHCPNEGIDYSALSYCWGDPTPAGHIQVDDQNISVAGNLLRFFVYYITSAHIRPDMYTFLWIDAVCLDQANTKEKSAQVNIMWSIYERASQVTAWLGDVTPPIEKALSVARALGKFVGPPSFEPGDRAISVSMEEVEIVRPSCGYRKMDGLLDDVACLTHHDYFQRMWTYQELLVATRGRKACFKTASSGCSVEELGILDEALHPLREEGSVHIGMNLNLHNLLWDWWVMRLAAQAGKDRPLANKVIRNYLIYTKDRQCLDPRDKVFALLGLPDMRSTSTQHGLEADYTMTTEDILIRALLRYEVLEVRSRPSNSPSDDVQALERDHKRVNEVAHLLCAALKLDQYAEEFLHYQMRVRAQEKDIGTLIAHSWVLSHLSIGLDHEAEGGSTFLKAVYRYWQQLIDENT